MGIFNRKASKKLTKSEKQRAKRLQSQLKPSTQNTIRYTSLYENGLMHVSGDWYSRTFKLGDVSYLTSQEDFKDSVVETYADAINLLDAETNYQLLVINKRIGEEKIDNILYKTADDDFNDYREEFDEIIKERFSNESNNFEVEKFITVGIDATDRKQAQRQLQDTFVALRSQFAEIDVDLEDLEGKERLEIFNHLLRGSDILPYNYHDIEISGLTTKSFIAPNRIKFFDNHMMIDNKFAKTMYVRQYPNFLSDRLIKSIIDVGVELAITIQARPYEPSEILKTINNIDTDIKAEMIKSQKNGFQKGISDDLAISRTAREITEATQKWKKEIVENDQKVFSGLIEVYFIADSLEELNFNTEKIKTTARKLGVDFEETFYYQEDALNTILPIGRSFLDVKKSFMRDMTTYNVATQIPFTNVDLQSDSPKALYYGQNQLSNNIITLDRKRDLNTGSGVVLGSSGSGKSVTVKAGEIIPTLLKYPEDRVIILDPEDEYSDIGKEFGAQLIDISIGSKTHLNLLDLPDKEKLSDEDSDPEGDKSNLLMGLFETILDSVTDTDIAIIDRVTRETYNQFRNSDRKPTLKDWHKILKEQPEDDAKDLALKSETYATGSQNIFAYETNVDISKQFVIFNLKKLTGKLKPFALMIIQDYIWNQVVENQGRMTTRIYFDEMQLLFKSDAQAIFFTELYSRVRKYGAIPTGITQNVETLTSKEEGRKLLANSEFIILLKQKKTDLDVLKHVLTLTDKQIRFVEKPKEKGTGLIIAGATVVPFENPISEESKLFKLIATDPKK